MNSRIIGLAVIVLVAFGAGMTVGRAQTAAWTPAIVHIPQITTADLGPVTRGGNQLKILAADEGGATQVQIGPSIKHFHANANEIQYIVEGSGKFWLGDGYKDVGPGDLIIIPKGVVHGGNTTAFKAIAIHTPPQASDDVHPVP